MVWVGIYVWVFQWLDLTGVDRLFTLVPALQEAITVWLSLVYAAVGVYVMLII